MRPLRLVLRAFGPYAGEEIVDFGHLRGRSCFLIHGPTGAGKTTVFDAISFALYGTTSGEDREGREMRSDHAAPSTRTSVTLDFTLGDRGYRVERHPQQERPRKRGGGTVLDPPRATLWRLASGDGEAGEGRRDDRASLPGDGKVIASQWSRVTAEVESLLGFRGEQFRQVMMLPQGRFRRLLAASSREREEILETLFETGACREIEEALKVSARDTARTLEEARQRRGMILEQSGSASEGELEDLLDRRQERLETLRREITELRGREREANERLGTARRTAEKLRERDDAAAVLEEIEKQRGAFEARGRDLERARRALPLVEVETRYRETAAECARAVERRSAAATALAEARKNAAGADAALGRERARDGRREELRRELARLDDLTDTARRMREEWREVAGAEKLAATVRARRDRAREDLGRSDAELRSETERRVETEKLALLVDTRRRECDEAERTLERRRRLDRLVADLGASRRAADELESRAGAEAARHRELQQQLETLEKARRGGQAALLAAGLTPGDPCPVCGSRSHPSPARATGALPPEEDLDALRANLGDLEAARERSRAAITNARSVASRQEGEIRALRESLGADARLDIPELESRARARQEALRAATTAREKLGGIGEAIEKLRQRKEAMERSTEALNVDLERAVAAEEGRRATLRQLEATLPEELRPEGAIDRARARFTARRVRLEEALESARGAAGRAAEDLAACEAALAETARGAADLEASCVSLGKDFQRRRRAAGFASGEEFEGARLEPAAMESLERSIRDFHGRLEAARERRQRALREAARLEPPDLERLAREAREIAARLEASLRESAGLEAEIRQSRRWVRDLARNREETSALQERYGVIGRVAEVAAGQNVHGMTFQRFVLAALLDDVLVAATERLGRMSRGRFYLERSRSRRDQRRSGGLDLEIYDTYTGTTRSVATLSGGEGFLASLALALGLADVVQSHAGGIRLDTVFIDEGFGSLDPEALDLALRAFTDLQRNGRLVGIISHVPELRERIDVRLEIIPGRRGSTSRFVSG